jgi:hypothetical protein
MNSKNCEIWLQISAGQGPLECAWVVMKVIEKIREEVVSQTSDNYRGHS